MHQQYHQERDIKMSTIEVNTREKETFEGKSDVGELRQIVGQLHYEIKQKNTRLKGLQALTTRLYESEEDVRFYRVKSENLEEALQLAQSRIAQLNIDLGKGPQTAFKLSVEQPGVSGMKYDKVVQENAKLKEDLDNFVGKDLGGYDIILENQKLHDLVSTLQRDLSKSNQHFNELNATLQKSGNPVLQGLSKLQSQVIHLTNTVEASDILTRQLTIKNNKLKQEIQELEWLKKGQMNSITDSLPNEDDYTLLKEKNKELEKEVKTLNEWLKETKAAQNEIEEEKKSIEKKVDLLRKHVLEQDGEINELTRNKLDNEKGMSVIQALYESNLHNLNEQLKEEKTKNEAFFKQIENLTQRQKKNEEEIQSLKEQLAVAEEECDDVKQMNIMMKDSMTVYENDFRSENQEKNQLKQENEKLKKLNQSHMATVKHLEDEYERLSKLLDNEKRNRKMQTGRDFGMGNANNFGLRKDMFTDNRHLVTVSDYGFGINEKDGGPNNASASLPIGGRHEYTKQPSLQDCPYCFRKYPVHLIEEHVRICMDEQSD